MYKLLVSALLVGAASSAIAGIRDGSFANAGAASKLGLGWYWDFYPTFCSNPGSGWTDSMVQTCANSDWIGGSLGRAQPYNYYNVGQTGLPDPYFAAIPSTMWLSQRFTADQSGVFNVSWSDLNWVPYWNLYDPTDVPTNRNHTYRVSLSGNGKNLFELDVNNELYRELPDGTYQVVKQGWTPRSSRAVQLVSGTQYLLTFQGTTNRWYSGSLIDEVRLVSDALPTVPEPSSWTTLIAGFGLVGAAARRRRPALVA